MDRTIHLLGLNHRSADVALRESFALPEECTVRDILPLRHDGGISEALILSTCNRVEILAVCETGDAPRVILAAWAARFGKSVRELEEHAYVHSGAEAVAHVFRVASGLDSLVLGEPQILGQLKDAYRRAVEEKTARVILNRLLHKAFMTAKRVRSQTGVSSSTVSVSAAAVSLARRIFGDLAGRRVLLVGAGDMAELAATHLAKGQGATIAVTNRTYERAVALAKRFGGRAVPFPDLPSHLAETDIVITSTGAPDPIITLDRMRNVMKARRDRTLFLIDIAVPRDVDEAVNELDNVYLYNIDDLAEVAEAGRAAREGEAARAEEIIREESGRFCEWIRSLGLQTTIADIVRRSETIMHDELEKTLHRIGPVPPEVQEALAHMLTAMGKKLNHDPIAFLKRRFSEEETGEQYLIIARRMFNLDGESVPEDAHIGRKRRC